MLAAQKLIQQDLRFLQAFGEIMICEEKIKIAWINQFDEVDKPFARYMLDSLITVTQNEFINGLIDLIECEIMNEVKPIALYSTVEVKKEVLEEKRIALKFFPEAATENNPKRMPIHYPHVSEVGSEGIIQKLCRDMERKHKGKVFSHPGVIDLRINKFGKILCIDDFAGSGKRTNEFVNWIFECQTMVKMQKAKLIKCIPIVYGCTNVAMKLLSDNRYIHEVKSHITTSNGRECWSDIERSKVKEICKRYAKKHKIPMPYGFKDAFSLIVFEHGMPNTNPSIMQKSSKSWNQLFESGRNICLTDSTTNIESVDVRISSILRVLGMNDASMPLLNGRISGKSYLRILCLRCISKRKRDPFLISNILGLKYGVINEILSDLQTLNLIDLDNCLTHAGRGLLSRLPSGILPSDMSIEISEENYYPSSLRSPVSSVSSSAQQTAGRK